MSPVSICTTEFIDSVLVVVVVAVVSPGESFEIVNVNLTFSPPITLGVTVIFKFWGIF